MKPHWGLALLVIIWTSADVRSQSGFDVTADAIMLNSSVYNAEVKLAFQTIGKHLTTVAVVFDHPDIVRNNPLTYNVQGTYRNQLAIDHQGRVTLKQKFSRAYTYRVQFSTLVTAYLSDNRTLSKFLEGWIYVRVLDVVYFHANASDGVNVSSSAKFGNSVFDCNDVVGVDKANFINPVLTFSSYYSSTFRVNPDGTVTMKKDVTDVNPGRYSMRITAYYTLSFKNGSLYSGRVYQYIRFYILGCSSAEEGNLQFPILHSCQATTHPCVKYHPMFKGGEVVRKCSIAGETLTLDFSNCTVSNGDFSTPFAVVSFTFSGTSGSTYTAALPRIRTDVESLFYSQASSVTEFSAYRSYKYYGFTMAFLVKLKQGTNDSIIAEAYQSLVSARRLGNQYLRYNRESRVVRAFLPSPGCKAFSEMPDNFTQFVQICQQTPSSNCICANINPTPTTGCENETFVDVAPSPSVSPSPTPEPAIHFTQEDYEVKYFADPSNRDKPVLTIKLAVSQPQMIKSYTYNFGLHGYYSDYFTIGHQSGIITPASALTSRVYGFDVTVFIKGVFTNGTTFNNYTQADITVFVHEGAHFRNGTYRIAIAADTSKGTQIFNLKDEIVYDPTALMNITSFQFTGVSSSYFRITTEGTVTTAIVLNPKFTYSFTAYLSFQGIALNNGPINGRITTRVYVSVEGCRQEEGGGHVWSSIHPCGIATVNCSEFDRGFDDYGTITRQCTKEGEWLSPDFSQCRLKSGTPPFVLLWVTFRSAYTSHWREEYTARAANDLRRYMGSLPVSSITAFYSRESNVIYGHMQSYKAFLRTDGPFNNTHLQLLWERIGDANSIDRRSINSYNYTYGVLGFLPQAFCPNSNPTTSDLSYKSVCTLSSATQCNCAAEDSFVPTECCTAEGKLERSEKCNATEPPTPACKSTRAAMTARFRVTSREITTSWTVTTGDWPDIVSINVFFRGFDEERHFVTSRSSLTTSYTVAGLIPSTVYLITVTGSYNESTCGKIYRTYGIKTDVERDASPLGPFQLRLNGVSNCGILKAKLQSDVRQWLVSGIRDSEPSFSNDRMGWLFMECPSGIAPSTAVISGWIYGSEGDPTDKYIKVMQKMVDSKAATKVGTQQLTMDPSCSVALTAPTEPHMACRGRNSLPTGAPSNNSLTTGAPSDAALLPSSGGDSSVAGTVVGIMIGIIISVLLALILVVLIFLYLKYKGGSKNTSAGSTSAGVIPVTLKEAKKQEEEEDETRLEEDF